MPQSPTQTIYFAYGSNLWLHQMRTRCPTSTYLGVALLKNYTWIINSRGYANVIEQTKKSQPSSSDTTTSTTSQSSVYGLVFSLAPSDESQLDKNEGVPIAYTKEHLACDFWKAKDSSSGLDTSKPPTETGKRMLVYIDRKRVAEDTPKDEYVYRLNRGIDDALKMGVPKSYVDGVMRKFIPGEGEDGKGKRMEEKALKQAEKFVDESGVC
jgi:gamma-glutamylcyclotransferase